MDEGVSFQREADFAKAFTNSSLRRSNASVNATRGEKSRTHRRSVDGQDYPLVEPEHASIRPRKHLCMVLRRASETPSS